MRDTNIITRETIVFALSFQQAYDIFSLLNFLFQVGSSLIMVQVKRNLLTTLNTKILCKSRKVYDFYYFWTSFSGNILF